MEMPVGTWWAADALVIFMYSSSESKWLYEEDIVEDRAEEHPQEEAKPTFQRYFQQVWWFI